MNSLDEQMEQLIIERNEFERKFNELTESIPIVELVTKINTATELAGIFHDGEWRSELSMEICEEYANKLKGDYHAKTRGNDSSS